MFRSKFNLRNVVAIAICLVGATTLSGCDKEEKEPPKDPLTYDEGVVINDVKWATRNVAAPSTFAAKPEDAGMFYQWNRKVAWPTTGDVTNWDNSYPAGDRWEKSNDPSPAGWRLPYLGEIQKLLDTEKVTNEWVTVNGVNGRKFTDKATGNSIFLPAVGARLNDGTLDNKGGIYWSGSQFAGFVHFLVLLDDDTFLNLFNCGSFGISVRCVVEQEQ